MLDRTDLGQERSILLLALAFGHRAIPLTWRVLPFGGTEAEVQLALLKEIQPFLPKPDQKRLMLLGDTEFRAVSKGADQATSLDHPAPFDTLLHFVSQLLTLCVRLAEQLRSS